MDTFTPFERIMIFVFSISEFVMWIFFPQRNGIKNRKLSFEPPELSEKELTIASQLCYFCNFNPCYINQNRLVFLQSADVEFLVLTKLAKYPALGQPFVSNCLMVGTNNLSMPNQCPGGGGLRDGRVLNRKTGGLGKRKKTCYKNPLLLLSAFSSV